MTGNPEKGCTSQTCVPWPDRRSVMPAEASRLVVPFSPERKNDLVGRLRPFVGIDATSTSCLYLPLTFPRSGGIVCCCGQASERRREGDGWVKARQRSEASSPEHSATTSVRAPKALEGVSGANPRPRSVVCLSPRGSVPERPEGARGVTRRRSRRVCGCCRRRSRPIGGESA